MSKPTEIGPVQRALINRGQRSTARLVFVVDYRELRAARKLVKRGVFIQSGTLPLFHLKEGAENS